MKNKIKSTVNDLDISVVKERKGRGERICEGTVAEGLHSAIKVIVNGPSILCREEGWEEENGARLQISQ